MTRNSVARRLRVVARERLDRLPGGTCLVLRALPAAAGAASAQLGVDLDACLDRLGVAPAVAL